MVESREITLHGHRMSYQIGGKGPVLVLVHGIAGSSAAWRDVLPWLSQRFTVVAPDLLGHGQSAKPRGDYSLGAYASGIRDLMVALGHDRATFVGHSLGGGVAMQLAYQFPERCERLVLVSSGGLGREVHLLLRAAALPGAEYVLPVLVQPAVLRAGVAIGGLLGRIGLQPGPDLSEFARGYGSLRDLETRQAFIQTLRAVIEPGGQRVSARDRLYLAAEVPTLIIWGAHDRIIPAEHGRRAHGEMPGSYFLEIPEAGHFPQLDRPRELADAIATFVNSTKPAHPRPGRLRQRLLEGPNRLPATRAAAGGGA
ncbi:MAG TPA: alpha/beta fold hydrolase [Solirubrobacteraceae bacterium]|nr:alpha/beta fold hydrolase [Solirubrobacteraceae bacterium]